MRALEPNLNIAFCFNDAYVDKIAVTMISVLVNNPKSFIHFYLFSSDLSSESINLLNRLSLAYKNYEIHPIYVDPQKFKNLKLSISYISIETYFRYIIAELLPDVDKILYLDGDIVVNHPIYEFYDLNLEDNYLGAVADKWIASIQYDKKLGVRTYVNAGVLLMNLKKMRADHLWKTLMDKTIELCDKIEYMDQDILNIVCANNILLVDSIYNFTTANIMAEKTKRNKAAIIHYTGAKKPWNGDVKMGNVWKKYKKIVDKLQKKKIKVGLLIDEFFGGAGTAYGGYGFLARKYIAKYIPDENIQIDVLLGRGKRKFFATKYHEDDVDLYRLPKKNWAARLWLKKQNYNIYLSIELTLDYVLQHETNPTKRLILWVQDPRPKSAWENVIDTMQSIKDPCFFDQGIYDTVHKWASKGRVKFITQGNTLTPLAKELYDLPDETPVQFLPNPIEIDFDYQFDLKKKKKQVIFLGRLEAQKRAWLFCEIAKRMPEYDFLVLGQFFRHPEDNHRMMDPYMKGDIPNLHFMGHVDGDKKKELIRESRILCSTAIWEGIPISWLEALSYGTVLVADLEREDLARRFGCFVGTVPGDGFDGVDKFIPAIKELMENDELYKEKAQKAIQYIRETHNIERFQKDLREVIYQEITK